MTNLHANLNNAIGLIIEAKLEKYENEINEKLARAWVKRDLHR